jgi:hypothetical protein
MNEMREHWFILRIDDEPHLVGGVEVWDGVITHSPECWCRGQF